MAKRTAIYVASSIKNIDWVREVQEIIRDQGAEIAYDWTAHGDVTGQGAERCTEVAQSEIEAVRRADGLIVLLPGGRGTHIEIGIALALEKPVLVLASKVYSVNRADSAFYFASRITWCEHYDFSSLISMAHLLIRNWLINENFRP